MKDQTQNDDGSRKSGIDPVIPPTSEPETSTEWHYVAEDGPHGPVSEQALIATIKSGVLNKKTLIVKEGMPKWILLGNTPFREFLPKTGPPPLDQVDTEGPVEKGKPPPKPQASIIDNGPLKFQISKTKRYKIYENRAGTREAVKQGWSWPAFFFTFIWAFMKKMNTIGAGVCAAFFILMIVRAAFSRDLDTAAAIDGLGRLIDVNTQALDRATGTNFVIDGLISLVNLAIIVSFGVNGNAWREKNLLSRAYEFKGTVAAENDEAALSRYMELAKSGRIPR